MSAPLFLMFPGQGSQYSGMGKDWFENFGEAKLAFEEASDGCGLNLKKLCFEGSEEDLKKTEVTQPAILTTTVAIFRSLVAQGALQNHLSTSIYAGHSLGEYSALVAMGTLSLGEAAKLVRHRGQYMQEAVPAGMGGMAALIFKPKTTGNWEKSLELCEKIIKGSNKTLSPANNNSPEQIVVAGHKECIDMIVTEAVKEPWSARRALPLPVSAPFHCALMKAAADRLGPELESARWVKPSDTRRYIANVNAQLHDANDAKGIQKRLVNQITGAVLWVQSVELALSQGAVEAVEIGPGAVLSGLVKRIPVQEKTLNARNVDRWEDYKNAGTFL